MHEMVMYMYHHLMLMPTLPLFFFSLSSLSHEHFLQVCRVRWVGQTCQIGSGYGDGDPFYHGATTAGPGDIACFSAESLKHLMSPRVPGWPPQDNPQHKDSSQCYIC